MNDADKWASIVKTEFDNGLDQMAVDDYEAYLDLLDAIRSEKDYDWQSDVFIPEFPSHIYTQLGIDVEQWFKTRDFVETFLEDSSDMAKDKALAAEKCINRTLFRRNLYFFQKFCRVKLINNLRGNAVLRCWWDKRYTDDELVEDVFQFDVVDPRQVRTSPEYAYSLQEKKWVTLWYEMSYADLKANKDKMGYFGLDELGRPSTSDLSEEVTNKDNPAVEEVIPENRMFDIYERHGWAWVFPDKEGEQAIGSNSEGKAKDGAVWKKTISTIASAKGTERTIRFQVEPYKREDTGEEYYPLIRALCYIHPIEDGGVGNGRYARELQVAINDAYNLGLDRSRLATIPVLKGKKYTMEDNSSIYIEPGHVMELEDPNDLTELKITDNTAGQLQQIAFLSGKMSQMDSVFPNIMGQLPAASTTATAVAGTESRANTRTNLTAVTFEYTAMTELYWMILQMTSQFAEPETGMELMGESVFDFDPTPDYWFKPVTQMVETESSRANKIAQLNQVLATVAQTGNAQAFNMILTEIMRLMGKEQENLAGKLLPENQPMQAQGTPPNIGTVPESNQNGMAMTPQEQMVRNI